MTAPAGGHYHAEDGTFRKRTTPAGAAREISGHAAAAAAGLPVPRLVGVLGLASGGCEVVYEDVFASGRARWLIADAINAADRDPGRAADVRALINAVCDALHAAAAESGAFAPLAACVPALYAARIAPGARLDRWYARPPGPTWNLDRQLLGPAALRARSLIVNGHAYPSAWPVVLDQLRAELAPHTQWLTAITQGDVTEPNVAQAREPTSPAAPLCWLDFEHAGRNALAGDLANLTWYLLGMGGWLVPAYQPATYERTLRAPVPPAAAPVVDQLRVDDRRVSVDYTWRVGPGRHAAIEALLRRLGGDLATVLAPRGGDPMPLLRPFLALRVLGVIPLSQLSGPDALLCLAKLAELTTPGLATATWSRITPAHPAASTAPVAGSERGLPGCQQLANPFACVKPGMEGVP